VAYKFREPGISNIACPGIPEAASLASTMAIYMPIVFGLR